MTKLQGSCLCSWPHTDTCTHKTSPHQMFLLLLWLCYLIVSSILFSLVWSQELNWFLPCGRFRKAATAWIVREPSCRRLPPHPSSPLNLPSFACLFCSRGWSRWRVIIFCSLGSRFPCSLLRRVWNTSQGPTDCQPHIFTSFWRPFSFVLRNHWGVSSWRSFSKLCLVSRCLVSESSSLQLP